MASNIQECIDCLSEKILHFDLQHIKGDQIVDGNPEHCINFLQLMKEISLMIIENEGKENDSEGDQDTDNENNDVG